MLIRVPVSLIMSGSADVASGSRFSGHSKLSSTPALPGKMTGRSCGPLVLPEEGLQCTGGGGGGSGTSGLKRGCSGIPLGPGGGAGGLEFAHGEGPVKGRKPSPSGLGLLVV